MEPQLPRLNQQRWSQGLRDTQRNPMEKLCPIRQQLEQVPQCLMVKLCQLLQIKEPLHSRPDPVRLAPLQRVSQRKAQLPSLLRTALSLQDRLRPPLLLHLNSFTARDPIPNHRLVMILRLHRLFQRASFTDHPRRRQRLKVIISDPPTFLPTSLKFSTKMVALARNLLTQD